MLNKKLILTGLLGIVGLAVSGLGCARVPSRLEAHYGDSFCQVTTNQILNPAAAQNLEPSRGLDGEAAKIAIDRYRETFKEEEVMRPVITTIK